MKKLIAVSAVAALAATALSAEITFGSWGRALWVTAANGGYKEGTDFKNTIVSDVHQSWGGAAPRTAFDVRGNSDNVGFALDIHNDGWNGDSNDYHGDNAYIWVKPIEQVKLFVGRMDDGTLAGGAGFGMWDWDRLGIVNNGAGDDWTFNKVFQNKGVNIQITPVEGLLLGAAIPLDIDEELTAEKDNGETLSGIYAHGAKYIGAYTIEGVGTIKAALETKPADAGDTKDKSHVGIDAAFDLTAVENLFASVGAKIDTAEKTAKVINAYARYGVNEQLTLHVIVGTKIGGPDKKSEKPADAKADGAFGFYAGAGVDYNLEDGIGLFADVRYANGIQKEDDSSKNKDNLVLGVGVKKGFSNGSLGIAFEGSTNSNGKYEYKDGKQFAWELPVRFEYCF